MFGRQKKSPPRQTAPDTIAQYGETIHRALSETNASLDAAMRAAKARQSERLRTQQADTPSPDVEQPETVQSNTGPTETSVPKPPSDPGQS